MACHSQAGQRRDEQMEAFHVLRVCFHGREAGSLLIGLYIQGGQNCFLWSREDTVPCSKEGWTLGWGAYYFAITFLLWDTCQSRCNCKELYRDIVHPFPLYPRAQGSQMCSAVSWSGCAGVYTVKTEHLHQHGDLSCPFSHMHIPLTFNPFTLSNH